MDLPSIIPVFPLPNVVLFPGVPLPLHIFETRYREMVREVAAGHEIIGMALLRGEWQKQYEENPDHSVTAKAVEAACWMAGMGKDYPEHFEAGLSPHGVTEKYYFARGPQLVNRVVDISAVMDRKLAVNTLNVAQGPSGQSGAQLRRSLRDRGLRLPILGEDDDTANREYTRQFVLGRDAETGKRYGVAYAEPYHYIGPEASPVEDYVRSNAVKL